MSAESNFCDSQSVSYSHRVYDADSYDWCIVPDTGYDVIVLAGIAVIVACICQGRLSNLMVLVAGGVLQGLLFPWNLGRLGNSVALWLNIEPYELFFYVFLPPLLLDAAVKLDFFLFKKVAVHCIALAFLVVAGSCALLIPVMLYIFQLHKHGWQWPHAALFGSMLASTDAVAIVATMKSSGGPHHLSVLLEGESLLNDATSITLFLVFLKEVQGLQSQANPPKVGAHEFGSIVASIIWLSVGGMLIGFGFGVAVRWLLRWMRQRDAGRDQQICLTLAVAYLSFYVANSPAEVSGVIAVVTYGLYGAYTTTWDMDVHILESGAFDSFYESLAFLVNGIIFFYSGVSCINFVVRSTEDLYLNSPISEAAAALWRLPLIYIIFNGIRFIVIFALRPLFKLFHRDLSTREVVFASIAGLRGSVSLIMAQAFVTESTTATPDARMIKAELVLWVAGFVLLSLIVNAPLLPWIMRITHLNIVPEGKVRMRRKAVAALGAHKQEGLHQLKDDPDEMLRGVDWSLVAEHVNMDNAYNEFLDSEAAKAQQPSWWDSIKGCLGHCKGRAGGRSAAATPGTATPHSHGRASGAAYDANAYWTKAPGSTAGSSADMASDSSLSSLTHTHSSGSSSSSSQHSSNGSSPNGSLQATAGNVDQAAELAAVSAEAEAALEVGMFDELPYLPATAVVEAADESMIESSAAAPSAVEAVQAGIDNLASAVKGIFGMDQGSSPEPGLLEVAVVADGSTNPTAQAAADATLKDKAQDLAVLTRQKSRSDKRPRLLLLPNGLFTAIPPTQAMALQLDNKQAIADGLKTAPTAVMLTTPPQKAAAPADAAAAAVPVKSGRKADEPSVRFAAAAEADESSFVSSAGMRRASVTSKGSESSFVAPAKRSKSFSAGMQAPNSTAKSSTGLNAAVPNRQQPFHQAAKTQISQHVERSAASAAVHMSAGSVATQLLDQLKGVRSGQGSQHDLAPGSPTHHHPRVLAHAETDATPVQHSPGSHHGSEADELAVADMRVRLLAGLKRYLHGKRLNGLLSSEGLRVLDNACETASEHALEHPDSPLDVWSIVERDCRGSWGVKLLARGVYQLHRLHQRLRRLVGPRPLLLWPLSRCIALGSRHLSKRLLLACEVAMELMLSLTYAHQVQWLQRHRPSHQLLGEVHEQSQKAWAFIIAREVEAPQRFQAIQSHRAAQAILHQQTHYVHHLLDTAVVDEDDGRHLLKPIQQRERQLMDSGPVWRTPSVAGVLRNLPFMRHAPPQVLEVLLQHGRLKMGHKQQPLRSRGEAGGAFVVISGIVRVGCEMPDGAVSECCLGAGATFGLYTALTGVKLPGQATAVAEGNALGKGALVYHLFPTALQTIQDRASGDVAGFKHVQLELFRLAGRDLLARLAPDLTLHLTAIFRAYARRLSGANAAELISSFAESSAANIPAAQPIDRFADGGHGTQAVQADTGKAFEQAHTAAAASDAAAVASEADGGGESILEATELLLPASRAMVLEPLPAVEHHRASMVSFSDTIGPLQSPASFSHAPFPTRRVSRLSQPVSSGPTLPVGSSDGADFSSPRLLAGPTNGVDFSSPVMGSVQETPKSMASVKAQAAHVQQQIEQDAKHGHLLMLQPHETAKQSSHVLVMQGKVLIEGRSVNAQLAPTGKVVAVEFVSPSVLPWALLHKHTVAATTLTAGPAGAILLVTPERPVHGT